MPGLYHYNLMVAPPVRLAVGAFYFKYCLKARFGGPFFCPETRAGRFGKILGAQFEGSRLLKQPVQNQFFITFSQVFFRFISSKILPFFGILKRLPGAFFCVLFYFNIIF